MATGSLDANGIWQYGEDDSEPTFSGLLNKLASSTSSTVTRLESFTGYTANLPIANGGTNASTAAAARINLSTGYRTKHVAIYDTGSFQQLTTSYDYLTGVGFTYAQRGLPIRLTVNITFYNLGSGSSRWGSYRILKDGTTTVGNAQVQIPVTYVTTNDRCSATYVVTTTTAASGNASFNVQALASTNSAVGVTFCHFQLEELEGSL